MKKITTVLLLSFGISTFSFAQGVWTGSTIPTTTSGKVGIGTTTPAARLSIQSSLSTNGTTGAVEGMSFKVENTSGIGGNESNLFEVYDRPAVSPGPAPYQLLYWLSNKGNVGIRGALRIGTTAATGPYANYKLSVDGDMIAKRCVIQVSNWADYVFHEAYALPDLNDVEQYVIENKHLPGVPSEKEVLEKGVEVGEMNKILLQKVEELTLYMIQISKENNEMKKQLEQLKSKQ